MTDTELIALVATDVMGWTQFEPKRSDPEWVMPDKKTNGLTGRVVAFVNDWNPITDPRAWWEVVERMKEDADVSIRECSEGWEVEFRTSFEEWAQHETIGRAVCIAALRAKGVECE